MTERDGEEQLQDVHRSVPVYPDQGEALQPRVWVQPRGEVTE